MPQESAPGWYNLSIGECLVDHWDKNMVIKGPDLVREEAFEDEGINYMRYQSSSTGMTVGVQAKDIFEAYINC